MFKAIGEFAGNLAWNYGGKQVVQGGVNLLANQIRQGAAVRAIGNASLDPALIVRETIEFLSSKEDLSEAAAAKLEANIRAIKGTPSLYGLTAADLPLLNGARAALLPALQRGAQKLARDANLFAPVMDAVGERALGGQKDPLVERVLQALRQGRHDDRSLAELEQQLDSYRITFSVKAEIRAQLAAIREEGASSERLQQLLEQHLSVQGASPLVGDIARLALGGNLPGGDGIPTAASLLQPFLQGGVWGGLHGVAARSAIGVLETIITHLQSHRQHDSDSALAAVQEAKATIDQAIAAADQTPAAYQRAFGRAWTLCTQFPIVVGGIELPIGLTADDRSTNPVKQLQAMLKDFPQNHSLLGNRAVTAEQTDDRLNRLAETGACFAAYSLCSLALGSPQEEWISFHDIMRPTKAMSKEQKKAHFLRQFGRVIEANTSINVMARWFIRMCLPAIHWFAELFSQDLTSGIKNHMRNVVIPSVRKEDDKRLHSGSIAALRTCFDDLNKMMKDFVDNPAGSASGFREHIRQVKDKKLYNGERTGNELYDDLAHICVEELMPKLAWTAIVGEADQVLNRWAQNSDNVGLQILKHIVVFPLRIPIWIAQYVFVAPVQAIMQLLVTWGAQKCFVETQLVQLLMDSIKSTNFRETPYVPVLDVVARTLMNIHEAQTNYDENAPSITAYTSDEENKKTIREFLDRAFRFIEMWKTNSREEMEDIINGPQGFVGGLKKTVEGALIPPIQDALVDLLELVQALATEETQLERYLFDICEIAETAFFSAGREVTREEKQARVRQYQDVRKLIECTLNAILWTVCIEATSNFGKPGTVKAAREHIQWLKTCFLGEGAVSAASSLSEAPTIKPGSGPLDQSVVDILSRSDDDEETLTEDDEAINPLLSESSTVIEGDRGVIYEWRQALQDFLTSPQANADALQQAYLSSFTLMRELETKEVALNIQEGSKPKPSIVTRGHLEAKSAPIFTELKKVCDRFHYLQRVYAYHTSPEPARLVLECLQDLSDRTSCDVLETLEGQIALYEGIPMNLASIMEKIALLRQALQSNNKPLITRCLQELQVAESNLTNEVAEAATLFGKDQTELRGEIASAMTALHQLETVVKSTSHVEFLQIDTPTPIKAAGGLALSLLQQQLFKEMSSRALGLIEAICHPEVFEMLIRSIAVRPLVESLRGERTPSYAKDA